MNLPDGQLELTLPTSSAPPLIPLALQFCRRGLSAMQVSMCGSSHVKRKSRLSNSPLKSMVICIRFSSSSLHLVKDPKELPSKVRQGQAKARSSISLRSPRHGPATFWPQRLQPMMHALTTSRLDSIVSKAASSNLRARLTASSTVSVMHCASCWQTRTHVPVSQAAKRRLRRSIKVHDGLPPPTRFVPASRWFDLPLGCFGLPCLSHCLVFLLYLSSVEAQLHRACSPGVCILFHRACTLDFEVLRWCFRHWDTTCDPLRPRFRLILRLCWAYAVASFRSRCPCLDSVFWFAPWLTAASIHVF